MKTLKLLSLAAIIFTFFIACSKDDDNNDQGSTTTEMLMTGKWYMEKIEGNDLNSCEKTSFVHFYGENSFAYVKYYSFNDVDCVSVESKSGTFELFSDTIIKVFETGTSEFVEYEILSLSNSELKLRMDDNHTYTFDKSEE